MRNDKKASSENYSFIKETIKEQPTDRKRLAGKFLTAAVCGVIFGACAAGTMALIVPKALERFGTAPDQKAVVTLTPSVKAEQVTPTPEATEQEKTSASTAWQNEPVRWDEPDRGGTAAGHLCGYRQQERMLTFWMIPFWNTEMRRDLFFSKIPKLFIY